MQLQIVWTIPSRIIEQLYASNLISGTFLKWVSVSWMHPWTDLHWHLKKKKNTTTRFNSCWILTALSTRKWDDSSSCFVCRCWMSSKHSETLYIITSDTCDIQHLRLDQNKSISVIVLVCFSCFFSFFLCLWTRWDQMFYEQTAHFTEDFKRCFVYSWICFLTTSGLIVGAKRNTFHLQKYLKSNLGRLPHTVSLHTDLLDKRLFGLNDFHQVYLQPANISTLIEIHQEPYIW